MAIVLQYAALVVITLVVLEFGIHVIYHAKTGKAGLNDPPFEYLKEIFGSGEECDTLYVDKDGDIFGCEECVNTKDAWEWAEEDRENQECLNGDAEYERMHDK